MAAQQPRTKIDAALLNNALRLAAATSIYQMITLSDQKQRTHRPAHMQTLSNIVLLTMSLLLALAHRQITCRYRLPTAFLNPSDLHPNDLNPTVCYHRALSIHTNRPSRATVHKSPNSIHCGRNLQQHERSVRTTTVLNRRLPLAIIAATLAQHAPILIFPLRHNPSSLAPNASQQLQLWYAMAATKLVTALHAVQPRPTPIAFASWISTMLAEHPQ